MQINNQTLQTYNQNIADLDVKFIADKLLKTSLNIDSNNIPLKSSLNQLLQSDKQFCQTIITYLSQQNESKQKIVKLKYNHISQKNPFSRTLESIVREITHLKQTIYLNKQNINQLNTVAYVVQNFNNLILSNRQQLKLLENIIDLIEVIIRKKKVTHQMDYFQEKGFDLQTFYQKILQKSNRLIKNQLIQLTSMTLSQQCAFKLKQISYMLQNNLSEQNSTQLAQNFNLISHNLLHKQNQRRRQFAFYLNFKDIRECLWLLQQELSRCQKQTKNSNLISQKNNQNWLSTLMKAQILSQIQAYQQSTSYYEICLNKITNIQGQNYQYCRIGIKMTLSYILIGNYIKAIQCLNKLELTLIQTQGINCLLLSSVYMCHLLIFNLQENFAKSLEQSAKSINILEINNKSSNSMYLNVIYLTANILEQQEKYQQAKKYYFKCLKLYQINEGPQSIQYALMLNHIGMMYKHQGYFSKSLQSFNQALQIRQAIFDEDSLQKAISYHNVGSSYKDLGNYQVALDYYTRCLELRKKVEGENTLECSKTLNNIATLYGDIGKLDLAIQYLVKTLQIQQNTPEDNSESIWATLNNLGMMYKRKGDFNTAMNYFQRSLSLLQSFNGNHELRIAVVLKNIAGIHRQKGQYQEAIQIYKKTLQIESNLVDQSSDSTAATYHNMASCYLPLGNLDLSESFYYKSLQIRQKIHGKLSKEYALTLNNIGTLQMKKQNFSEAEKCFRQSLQTEQKITGEKSLSCALMLFNLSHLMETKGQSNQALQFASKAYEIKKDCLGENHYETQIYKSRIQKLQNKYKTDEKIQNNDFNY